MPEQDSPEDAKNPDQPPASHPISELTYLIRHIRHKAAGIIELVTGNTLSDCLDKPAKYLKSQFKMAHHFDDIPDQENNLLTAALKMYKTTELADGSGDRNEYTRYYSKSLGESGSKHARPEQTPEKSTRDCLRELDNQSKMLQGAFRACRKAATECAGEARGPKEKKLVIRFKKALAEMRFDIAELTAEMDKINDTIRFRGDSARGV